MTGTRVELRIRRLELDARVRPSRAALCAAVEAELAVLLGHASAVAGRPAVPADPHITDLARHIARAVHAALRERRREAVPRAAAAAQTIPRDAASRETTPRETTPREAAPREAVPHETVPPGTTAPGTTVPGTTAPEAGERSS
ncbi:hypothetical protein [Streptomyces sp.]|uniref:hypothetical protein n=1 Tax=Streptomyces sp. TaxID=1931 RepID=UPI002D596F92|nr:hypothetical protein [Streptomyces sp.]HZF91067.1 hypothetical protein [Streptomyces sp.]